MAMIRCKFYHFLFDAVPLNAFQSFLIKKHSKLSSIGNADKQFIYLKS